jgi:hypothetical protein
MSVVYTLFEDVGKFRSYCMEEKQMTDELFGGIRKEIPVDEWDVNYTSGRLFPSLDVSNDIISWVARPGR